MSAKNCWSTTSSIKRTSWDSSPLTRYAITRTLSRPSVYPLRLFATSKQPSNGSEAIFYLPIFFRLWVFPRVDCSVLCSCNGLWRYVGCIACRIHCGAFLPFAICVKVKLLIDTLLWLSFKLGAWKRAIRCERRYTTRLWLNINIFTSGFTNSTIKGTVHGSY